MAKTTGFDNEKYLQEQHEKILERVQKVWQQALPGIRREDHV